MTAAVPGVDSAGEAVTLADLKQSAATLISMQRVQVPSIPVSTATEREKYSNIFLTFAGTNRSHSFLDHDAFALKWNKDASAMKRDSLVESSSGRRLHR